jgi:hypothetical protein
MLIEFMHRKGLYTFIYSLILNWSDSDCSRYNSATAPFQKPYLSFFGVHFLNRLLNHFKLHTSNAGGWVMVKVIVDKYVPLKLKQVRNVKSAAG